MVENYRDWMAKSDEDLIAQWDSQAPHVVIGLDFIAGELQRRRMERAGQRMERLTWIVTALTAVSVVVSAIALVVALQ